MEIRILKKILERPCPICGETEGELLHTQEFTLLDEFNLPLKYDIVSCCKCGFSYADTPATQAQYDEYYSTQSKYTSQSIYRIDYSNDTYITQQKTICDEICEITPEVRNKRIIDIGCSMGVLLDLLKLSGFKHLTGMDPSPFCVELLKGKGYSAHIGTITQRYFGLNTSLDQEYDVVLMTMVLEHICDLNTALDNLYNIVADSGYLYISIPDAAEYKNNMIVPYYYFDIEHINHFDDISFTNLALKHGFNVIKSFKHAIPFGTDNKYGEVVFICKKMNNKSGMERDFIFSPIAKDSIINFVDQSKKSIQLIIVNELASSNEELVIFGAGNYTYRLLSSTVLQKCNIAAFVDNDEGKVGKKILNWRIYNVNYLLNFSGTIVVATALHSKEIVQQLKSMGIVNKVVIL